MFQAISDYIKRLLHLPTTSEVLLSIENSGLTETQLKALRKCLDIFELSPNHISKKNIFQILFALGHNPSDDFIEFQLRLFKLNHRETLTIDHLAHVWSSILNSNVDEVKILSQAFQFFDRDGNGELSIAELNATMKDMGNLLTESEIEEFMAIMDVNQDGAVDYNEFLYMLKSQINLVDLIDKGILLDDDAVAAAAEAAVEAAESMAIATAVPGLSFEGDRHHPAPLSLVASASFRRLSPRDFPKESPKHVVDKYPKSMGERGGGGNSILTKMESVRNDIRNVLRSAPSLLFEPSVRHQATLTTIHASDKDELMSKDLN
uniref:EF-hand domain-containing protein n=1 Tax=Polytomella parva TaxID=51329 RepID=A0A7S0YKJ7_9CHLO|mmetsp:Transcript_33776/g.60984  ORF Transcript_33776/g.60984 Transcript_33776/m.60984 type:complete len:320 (+) Transcript_33776:121-1080(+)